MTLIRTIFHPEGTYKVEIHRGPDGTFRFVELKWFEEGCWGPHGRYSAAVMDTLEHALEEVKGRVPWVTEALLGQS
jgi:hypothetical protein